MLGAAEPPLGYAVPAALHIHKNPEPLLAAKVKSGSPPPPTLAFHVPLNCHPVGIAAQVPSPFRYKLLVPPDGT